MNIKYCYQSTNIVVLDKYNREKNDNNKNATIAQILVRNFFDKSF